MRKSEKNLVGNGKKQIFYQKKIELAYIAIWDQPINFAVLWEREDVNFIINCLNELLPGTTQREKLRVCLIRLIRERTKIYLDKLAQIMIYKMYFCCIYYMYKEKLKMLKDYIHTRQYIVNYTILEEILEVEKIHLGKNPKANADIIQLMTKCKRKAVKLEFFYNETLNG